MRVLHAVADGSLLAVFMISAAVFAVLIFHPEFLGSKSMPPMLRRGLMGAAMGATAAGLIYSPVGKYSGAHMNPSVTLAFLLLGKVQVLDAALYIAAQCVIGYLGMKLAHVVLGKFVEHDSVGYVTTEPGPWGVRTAAIAEFSMSFVLLLVVLYANNNIATHRFTGVIAGALLAALVMFLAPLSGVGINPARTLASALVAGRFKALWMYIIVPPVAMVLAGQTYMSLERNVFCAKMCHLTSSPCPFRCEFAELAGSCDSCNAQRQPSNGEVH